MSVSAMSVVRGLLNRMRIARYRRSVINQQLRDERGRSELEMAREGIKNPRIGTM